MYPWTSVFARSCWFFQCCRFSAERRLIDGTILLHVSGVHTCSAEQAHVLANIFFKYVYFLITTISMLFFGFHEIMLCSETYHRCHLRMGPSGKMFPTLVVPLCGVLITPVCWESKLTKNKVFNHFKLKYMSYTYYNVIFYGWEIKMRKIGQ